MHRLWLLAGGAGLLSATVFLTGVVAVLKESPTVFMLAYLSPAPLFAAALGINGPASIVAAATGLVPVLLAGGLQTAAAYAALIAVPAAILGRQAMLSRQSAEGETEWYPPGALVAWLCAIGVAIYTLLSLLLLSQPAGLSGTVHEALTQLAEWMQMPETDKEIFVGFLHPIVPGTAVASLLLLHVANGALAQWLLSTAGRAIRPAPDIGALVLPGWIPAGGAIAALAALVLGGEAGYFARNLVIVAAVPFFLQGLSVVHVLARRTGGGAMLLAVFYVTLIVLGWVAVMLVLLGLVEQIVGIRQRLNRTGQT